MVSTDIVDLMSKIAETDMGVKDRRSEEEDDDVSSQPLNSLEVVTESVLGNPELEAQGSPRAANGVMVGIKISDDISIENDGVGEIRRHIFENEDTQTNTALASISYNLEQEIELLEQWKETDFGPPGFQTKGPCQNSVGLVNNKSPSDCETKRLSKKLKKMGKETNRKIQQRKKRKTEPPKL